VTTAEIPKKSTTPAEREYRQEWGRTEDVERVFGIRRGMLYNLHKGNPEWGKTIPGLGKSRGIRVWNMAAIRRYVESLPVDCSTDSAIDEFEDENKKAPQFPAGPNTTSQSFTFALPVGAGVSPTFHGAFQHSYDYTRH
jgi:hypothetical protein